MRAKTLFDKLWDEHRVLALGNGVDLIHIDRVLLHERTGSIALASLAAAGRDVAWPEQVFCCMDHIVDTRPGRRGGSAVPNGEEFITATRTAAAAAGITLFDLGDPWQGIVHVVSPELGIVQPGLTVVCPDSHTCTQGAFGALAWGVGTSDIEHALATKTLRLRRPRTMRVLCHGELGHGVTAKDLILHLLARHGVGGGRGHAVEFAGEAVAKLDMEARMTLCNMAVEFAAFTGLIAPDRKAADYLKGRAYAPAGGLWEQATAWWQTLRSDEEARFDRELAIDCGAIEPMVSWGTSPDQCAAVGGRVGDRVAGEDGAGRDGCGHCGEDSAAALGYMAVELGQPLTDLAVDCAYIGSCTNARLTDLRLAARVLRGRRVAAGVRALCVPGSSAVRRAAEAEGLDRVLIEAGFEWRESGCAMCFYAGGEHLGAEQRVISTTNRNFENRQGPRTRTHIASPAVVAASAVRGHIADPREWL